MRQVLNRVLVYQFYRINAGFFLFLFLLLFGIVDAQSTVYFHYSIMKAAAAGSSVLWLLMGCWLLYTFKCAGFVLRALQRNENTFLLEMGAIAAKRQYQLLLNVHWQLLAPMLWYGFITAGVAFLHRYLLSGILILLFLLLLLLVFPLTYQRQWRRHTYSVLDVALSRLPSASGGEATLNKLLLRLSFTRHKRMLALLKIFSLILLQAMIAYNKESLNKESVCFFIMIIIAAHAMLPYFFVQFMETEMRCLRNFPSVLPARAAPFLLAYSVLFLPEVTFLLLHARTAVSLPVTGSLYLLAISQLWLYTSLLYMVAVRTERYMGYVLGGFFISMMLLAGLPVIVIASGAFLVGALVFLVCYGRYEPKYEPPAQ